MLLLILGLAFVIVITVFAYKTAKDYERNAIVWALITFAVGFTIQIILPVVIVIIIAVVMTANGKKLQQIQQDVPEVTIDIICLALSVGAGLLILRYLSTMPEEKPFVSPPLPPTDFN